MTSLNNIMHKQSKYKVITDVFLSVLRKHTPQLAPVTARIWQLPSVTSTHLALEHKGSSAPGDSAVQRYCRVS